MEKLIIAPTQDTPGIHFDAATNVLELSGRSYPDNVFAFYEPVFSWLNAYASALNPAPITKFIFKLEYFNTASAKIIFDILHVLDRIKVKGNEVQILWYYKNDDDDMKEAGEGYKNIIETNIEIVSY